MPDLAPQDLDALLDRQKQAWADGRRPTVEELLTGSPFDHDTEIFLDLLYNEIVTREELGEAPSAEEYARRYPHLRADLQLHFEVHSALHEQLLGATHHVHDTESTPDRELAARATGPGLEDYEIVGQLGRGGMGVVYRARHRRLRRLVALKMFQPGWVPSPRELLRFHTEAEAIARLQHPNIVQIFEVGQAQGRPFLALELAPGGTLADKLQILPFAARAAAGLVQTLARAVQHAHAQQIVHRDLKPANVLFAADGTPKLTDFGLAKMLEESPESPRDATRTGEPLGTPRYMAPEQAAGRPDQVGPGTDIWALGAILYECLTGQAPFVAPSAVATLALIREEEPRPPRRLQRSVPRDLQTICLKCLHKQPGRRYASAGELADDLGRFLNGEPIHARPTPLWERGWMWGRRRPALAVLVALSVLVLFATPVTLGVNHHREQRRVAALRAEVVVLMHKGDEALARDDAAAAEQYFLTALAVARGEPALRDLELGIAGWLDHSRSHGDLKRWQQRRPPPLFEELRDEAFVQCALLDPRRPADVEAARDAIQIALERCDPANRREREQLTLVEADLVLRAGDAAAALDLLENTKGIESRLWHQRRADCLERLGRAAEADEVRRRGDELPPQHALGLFLSGLDRLHRDDPDGAIRDFDQLLARAPNHFLGRWCQALCFLRRQRLGEAKVALTACLGQRPYFAWTCLLLARARAAAHDPDAALREYQRGLDMRPRDAARRALLTDRGVLHLRLGLAAVADRSLVCWRFGG
jgi:tetratricopeptide (TPR) repeat protein